MIATEVTQMGSIGTPQLQYEVLPVGRSRVTDPFPTPTPDPGPMPDPAPEPSPLPEPLSRLSGPEPRG